MPIRSSARMLVAPVALIAILASRVPSAAFDADVAFPKNTVALSFEAAFVRFGARLSSGSSTVQAFNISPRVSILPFSVLHFHHLSGLLDGALELGIEPTYQYFNTQHRNFAGLGLALKYYLTGLSWGPLVPWIDASIAPGWTDLNIGRVRDETRLSGPFMNLIQAGPGVSYFFSERGSVYLGLRAQHISNAGLNRSNHNYSLDTAEGLVVGMTWFIP